jgi:hypothetical protein
MSRPFIGDAETPVPLAQNTAFLLLTGASAVSSLGTRISALALPLLILHLTQSPALAGMLGAARMIPYLLLSVFAGAWADRADRRVVLVACDVVRSLALLSIPVAYLFGVLSIPQLVLVLLIEGSGTVMFAIAELAALPHVVRPEQVGRARAVNEAIDAVTGVVGPGVAGLIINVGRNHTVGAMFAYLADGISYLMSGFSLALVRRPLQGHRGSDRVNLLDAIGEGMRFLWRERTLRALAVLTTVTNFLQAPMSLCLIILGQQRLGLSAAEIGAVFGIAGGAGVAGAVLAPIAHSRLSMRTIATVSAATWALSAGALGMAGNVVVLTIGWALTQLLWPIYSVALVSYRLAITPDPLQGRVTSAFRTFSYGVEPLGPALGGVLVAVLGAPVIFGVIALALTCCAIGAWLVRPDLAS